MTVTSCLSRADIHVKMSRARCPAFCEQLSPTTWTHGSSLRSCVCGSDCNVVDHFKKRSIYGSVCNSVLVWQRLSTLTSSRSWTARSTRRTFKYSPNIFFMLFLWHDLIVIWYLTSGRWSRFSKRPPSHNGSVLKTTFYIARAEKVYRRISDQSAGIWDNHCQRHLVTTQPEKLHPPGGEAREPVWRW